MVSADWGPSRAHARPKRFVDFTLKHTPDNKCFGARVDLASEHSPRLDPCAGRCGLQQHCAAAQRASDVSRAGRAQGAAPRGARCFPRCAAAPWCCVGCCTCRCEGGAAAATPGSRVNVHAIATYWLNPRLFRTGRRRAASWCGGHRWSWGGGRRQKRRRGTGALPPFAQASCPLAGR